MNTARHLFDRIGVAFFATLWCTTPVWGDDTEIFFGDIDSAAAKPNVLFIIDTSGSMNGTVADTGKDRLDNVKDAFYQLMDELDNVNVGLMRFTNPGGPVLFPVRNIDAEADAGSIVTVDTPVRAGNDDAQELVDTNEVILDSERIEMVEFTSGGFLTYEDQVDTGDNDAEEYINTGESWNFSTVLDVDSNRRIGMRFTGSSVPKGAVITNAYMRFTGANDGDSDPLALVISGEQDDTASGFVGTNNELRDRGNTVATVDWNLTRTVVSDETVDTPNIAPIIQEIVNDPDWDPGNGGEDDIVLVVESASTTGNPGERDFVARNASATRAPQLFVEYYVGTPPATGESVTGLRFDVADIPRGVTVTDARIVFTAQRDFSTTHAIDIRVENSGDAQPFSASAGDISSRDTQSKVDWDGFTEAFAGDSITTPSLSDLVERVTDDSDWCGGNAISFVLEGDVGQIPVWSFEGNESLAPRLVVQYEYDSIPAGGSCIKRTLNRSITASTDDVEEGQTLTTGAVLDFLPSNPIGLRFSDLGIPQGATVSEAYLDLTAYRDDSGTTALTIAAESSPDADTYSGTAGTVTGRNYFSPAVTWNISQDWDEDDVYRSPNIGSLITQVVAQGGWEVGNALGLKIETPSTPDRRARTFDNSPGQAPRLVVTFEDDGTGLTSRKVREVMKDLVSQLNHNGWTPIQDTLYEAALYYTGMEAKWGKTRGESGIDGGPFSYARVSSLQSMVPGTASLSRPAGCTEDNLDADACAQESIGGTAIYDSPIDDFCQEQSHIILLTDGEANRPHSRDEIADFIGESCANEPTVDGDQTIALSGGEQCVKDLVSYMNGNDMRSTLSGNQRITTHTIGFNFSSKWLEDVATAGGGVYTTAANATELVDEIKDIIGEVLKTDSTFVAPVAAVNQFNQLSHLAQVYFAVFRPDEFPRWRGNLKRYTLSERGADIVDADGNLAIDPSTGFFAPGTRSFWSASPDGTIVDRGGAAENLPANTSRNVYTYLSGSTSTNLANSVNAVVPTNADLDPAAFDATSMTATEFEEHIQWIRGRDVDDEDDDGNTTENRYVYGDPLHSRPIAITYGGTESNPEVEIFFGTNAGGIQAVDATDGQETFVFFPEAMLPMQNELRQNLSTTAHPYGVDGTPTPWFNDNGRNGIDPSDAQDFVRIFTGMRRGGRNYYALDVTDRGNPEIMWQIEGGTNGTPGDFRELGQTWSRPVKTKISINGETTPRDVLIFTAGYDEAQDDTELRTTDSVGRGMYIVDAVTGQLIWSGGRPGAQTWTREFAAMDYSFPSNPSVIDINQDGLADMWFVADTGGQLWRFDIRNGESLSNLVQGGVVADLGIAGGTNDIVNNRRFFASPSVALIRGPEGPELAVAIGSGFRPSPLSVLAQNRMYLIRQLAVFGPPSTYSPVTVSDLYDATDNTLADPDLTDAERTLEQEALNASRGWYFDFTLPGEKALASPLIANDRIIFTTYTPGDSGIWCRPAAGQSRAYAVRLEDAVRTEPRPLLTPSIVDQATIIVPPPYVPDPNDPEDPNDPYDPNDPGNPCPNGNDVSIKLNAEDGPVDNWCNDASKTYWIKER